MDINKKCSECNLKFFEDNYEKERTICRNCCNKTKRKCNEISEKDSLSRHNESVKTYFKNIRRLIVGPCFTGITQLILKVFSRIRDRYIYIFTKSPPGQYSTSKIKVKENSEEIKPLNEHESALIVFDDLLGSSSCKYIDKIFRHHNLDIFCLSQ